MEEPFLKERLEAAGLRVDVPDVVDRAFIHEAIRNELLKGIFSPATKGRFLSIIDSLARGSAGA